jgi:ribosome biogenesis GTPase
MKLEELGFDNWFKERMGEGAGAAFEPARIAAVDRDRYLVLGRMGEAAAQSAGKLLYLSESSLELPCVGDWVLVQYHNEGALAIVHDVLPRKTVLKRKAAGREVDFQLIAANIDTAFIVQSCDDNFNIRRLERYLAVVNQEGTVPIVLLSKSDLNTPEELEQKVSALQSAGINDKVIAFSNMQDGGWDQIGAALEAGKTYCLLGSSGVGKTTLLNHLLGEEQYATKAVREKDSRGRHTTVRRQLTRLTSGAMIIDNPGMRELAVMDVQEGIEQSFADIQALTANCRFRDCTHKNEKGCAVLEAIERGDLSEERHRSYLKLLKESQFYEMSYVERRRRDKKFGVMIKSVMKHKKKKR